MQKTCETKIKSKTTSQMTFPNFFLQLTVRILFLFKRLTITKNCATVSKNSLEMKSQNFLIQSIGRLI